MLHYDYEAIWEENMEKIIKQLANELNINIKILTGSTKTSQRKIIHEELENGTLQILIGTHALLQESVVFLLC